MHQIPNDSPQLTDLCNTLVTDGSTPIRVPYEAMPKAVERDCYGNVTKKIEASGGSMQTGWHIVEGLPGVLLEAEFHAVWIDAEGNYHDVTPRSPEVEEILFLPDKVRKYNGKQINNVRVPLQDDPLISEYIANEDRIFEAMNAGGLADRHGEILIDRSLIERRETLGASIYEKYYLN
jgi:hypothetical protein